ncbi:MAG: hemerythrin domain-containing protein [Daejeonella sp.]
MKRHTSLISLSREHHGALILARLLRQDAPPYKGLPGDAPGKADYALKFYQEEMIEHFHEEEKVISLVRGINPELDILFHEMEQEHTQLHELFSLINNNSDLPGHLDKLGRVLEDHVRKEERQIFPMIQDNCSEDVLNTIAETLKT